MPYPTKVFPPDEYLAKLPYHPITQSAAVVTPSMYYPEDTGNRRRVSQEMSSQSELPTLSQ